MRTSIKVENPDDVLMSMTITMTVKQWTELQQQLQNTWPSWVLSSRITTLIHQARKVFYAEQED
jgi:hypothetical protein